MKNFFLALALSPSLLMASEVCFERGAAPAGLSEPSLLPQKFCVADLSVKLRYFSESSLGFYRGSLEDKVVKVLKVKDLAQGYLVRGAVVSELGTCGDGPGLCKSRLDVDFVIDQSGQFKEVLSATGAFDFVFDQHPSSYDRHETYQYRLR